MLYPTTPYFQNGWRPCGRERYACAYSSNYSIVSTRLSVDGGKKNIRYRVKNRRETTTVASKTDNPVAKFGGPTVLHSERFLDRRSMNMQIDIGGKLRGQAYGGIR